MSPLSGCRRLADPNRLAEGKPGALTLRRPYLCVVSMSFEDKNLTCVECGSSFIFSAVEQEQYQQRGYTNEPKRCAPCRDSRRQRMGGGGGGGYRGGGGGGGGGYRGGGGGGGGSRESHTVICAECGREASVPFKPRGDRPVYCSDCFRSRR